MPASKKITKDAVIDAALEIIREKGIEFVNARSVAQKLNCSTQPIYLCFKNMRELKEALKVKAKEEHFKRIRSSMSQNAEPRYIDYGIGFVNFAKEEKYLFRWIYMQEGIGKEHYDMFESEIIKLLITEHGFDKETAASFHRKMTYYSYGIAVLVNRDKLTLSKEELTKELKTEFTALKLAYDSALDKKN